MAKELINNLKQQILQSYKETFNWKPISDEVKNAFFEVDRHKFVSKYKNDITSPYITLEKENIEDHLTNIYRDKYLITKIDEQNNEVLSSISQPSLVLYMLMLGEIKRGSSILEIGTGSGWNAALISKLLGPKGKVTTTEIDRELVTEAQLNLNNLGISNVDIMGGDGAVGAPGKVFDIVFYTVGIYDIPSEIYDQVKENGLLILILKNHGGGDSLIKLRKRKDIFVSEESIPCGFVQIQGSYRLKELQPHHLATPSMISDVWKEKNFQQRFWFGGSDTVDFFWKSMPFKAFLSIVEPYYVVVTEGEDAYFGVFNPDEYSLSVFTPTHLIGCGNNWGYERLQSRLNEWVSFGMPTVSAFNLEARKLSSARSKEPGEYLITRQCSQFFYSI